VKFRGNFTCYNDFKKNGIKTVGIFKCKILRPAPEDPFRLQGEKLPIISRILKVLNDFDTLITAGYTIEEAYKIMQKDSEAYDPKVLVALDIASAGIYEGLSLESVYLKDLKPGVVAAADIVDENGFVLVTKGAEITQMLIMKLENYNKLGKLREPIQILC